MSKTKAEIEKELRAVKADLKRAKNKERDTWGMYVKALEKLSDRKKKIAELEKPKEKKWTITINTQLQFFSNLNDAVERMKQLLDANIWWVELTKE